MLQTMRRILLLPLFLLSLSASAQSGAADYERLYGFFREAAQFCHRYPREGVYLHLDNNAYFEGDTIWLKAYVYRVAGLVAKPREHLLLTDLTDAEGRVVRQLAQRKDEAPDGSEQRPLSRVLYVDLLNVSGQVVSQRLLRIDSLGQAHGEIELSLPVKSGYYEVRAYTREMVNWGPEACFSRVVPVFKRPKDLARYGELDIDRPETSYDLIPSAPREVDLGKASEVRLTMFPEGGSRIENAPSRIAYKLLDGRGAERSDTVRLWTDGSVADVSVPMYQGMGLLNVPAYAGRAYVEVAGERFELPRPAGDYAMAVTAEHGGAEPMLHLCVSRRQEVAPTLLGLAVTCRDEVCYFDTLRAWETSQVLDIPMHALRGGVNRIELYDASGRSLCRRLVWKMPEAPTLQLDVRQNETAYEPFAPVALTFALHDAKGNPVRTTFSLSVRDGSSEVVRPASTDICADLLLASELRGYVHRPEDYFLRDDDSHRRALDLLLMVQGWTPTAFEVMNGARAFELREPIEEHLMLKGRLYEENDKKRPLAGYNLHLSMMSRAGAALTGDVRTDSLGRFAFQSSEDFCGEWMAQFTTTNAKGRKRWSRIALDRFYNLPPRRLGAEEMELTPPLQFSEEQEDALADTFEWTDTIMRIVPYTFDEATIVKRSKYAGFTGNRYTYNGGEKAGMRVGDVYYDIEREVERYKDSGASVGSIWELLAILINNYSYDRDLQAAFLQPEDERTDPYETEAQRIARKKQQLAPTDYHGRLDFYDRYWANEYLRFHDKRPDMVFFNNYDHDLSYDDMIWADEVKSVVLVGDRSRWERYLEFPEPQVGPLIDEEGNLRGDYAIFVYNRPDYYNWRTKRGVDKRMVTGYTQPLPFLAPSYNGADLPSPSDLRRTLYWNPCVETDAEGRASAVFYSNAREGVRLRISARGITPQGVFSVEK